MDREHQILEKINGQLILRFAVTGHYKTMRKLHELAEHSHNELRAIHTRTGKTVAVANGPRPTKP